MKSKLFNSFYEKSHSMLYPLVKRSDYFLHLEKRLNIFHSPEKRELLIYQKLEYIFKNFDIDFITIILDHSIKKPKYTKNREVVFPSKNEEINFFDIAFIISEIILVEFLSKNKTHKNLFASIYKYALTKIYKIEAIAIDKLFAEIGIEKTDSFYFIYDSFVNKDAWTLLAKNYHINAVDMKKKKSNLMLKYFFKKDKESITVCVLNNKKIKVFIVDDNIEN